MNGQRVEWREFADGESLARALASTVAGRLSAAIDERGRALLAVSGGTTPGRFFDALSKADIDWRKISVTLVDERFVERSSPRSNAALVKGRLLRERAAAATFFDLYDDAADVETAAAALEASFARLPWPLDVAVLGMGGDGHTASFFPDAANLARLTDPASAATVLPVHAASAAEPRLTLSLARLRAARFPVLHIEGEAKRTLLDAAMAERQKLPILSLLEHTQEPVRIFWAP